MGRFFMLVGCANAALSVLFGAFAAHGLQRHVSAAGLEVFQIGTRYHLYHALALMCIGLIVTVIGPSAWLRWSGWAMLTGVIFFSGSLYLIGALQMSYLGLLTPLGGLMLLAAWVVLFVGIYKSR